MAKTRNAKRDDLVCGDIDCRYASQVRRVHRKDVKSAAIRRQANNLRQEEARHPGAGQAIESDRPLQFEGRGIQCHNVGVVACGILPRQEQQRRIWRD